MVCVLLSTFREEVLEDLSLALKGASQLTAESLKLVLCQDFHAGRIKIHCVNIEERSQGG